MVLLTVEEECKWQVYEGKVNREMFGSEQYRIMNQVVYMYTWQGPKETLWSVITMQGLVE
jgi:hypothetical protein